ncbi:MULTISPECIES: Gfo/Idh/MocA family oxidoreductase [Streptomyces violaceusniger group]|uniref:Gfo/Idh/MocA-like oxidoreductase N-terminal domain-containing protein n=2 Tax=Streptomyces rhizosphaericus TaxID=114699 RepID=A0ABN1SAR9_9ACTN|nr:MULTISPECIES: Gfo/Idh/MocA family oxidoreductase [Streptomyces violaceusniger group]
MSALRIGIVGTGIAGLEAVTVCTPRPSHGRVVVAAHRHAVYVLCEKPIAVPLAEADRVGSGRGSSRSRSLHPRPRREKPATPAERAGVPPVRPRTHGGELAASPRKNGPVPVTTRSAVATIRMIEPVLASADPKGES